jgi:glycosyltransferase involved in cell wall biosynthesis
MVSVVIPAFNETNTISQVIKVADSHKWVKEIIVVDDGSEDDTSIKSIKNKVNITISLPKNEGKAAAMERGVAHASNDVICFLDADIKNLNQKNLTKMLRPVTASSADMSVGICGREKYKLNKLLIFLPILGGQRVLKKKIWHKIPPNHKKDFQIEIALNYFSKVTDQKINIEILDNLKHVPKEKKYGITTGLWRRLTMCLDIMKVSLTLYCYETAKRKVKQILN